MTSPLEVFLGRVSKPKQHGKSWMACCPAHNDKSPSLSIAEGEDGRLLVHCHAGCEYRDIMAAVGLDARDGFAEALSPDARRDYKRQKLQSARQIEQFIMSAGGNPDAVLNDEDVQRLALANSRIKQLDAELAALDEQSENTADPLFTPPPRDYVRLPESFKRTELGKLAARIAYCIEFPEASTALALLAGASAAVATSYAVQYQSGTPVPAGIYAVIEQPPSMMKSRLLTYAQSEYLKAIHTHNRKIYRHCADSGKDDFKPLPGFDVTTDSTAAGLDMQLAGCNEGRFFVASAEQAAFQSLFPESGDFASHNGLLLQGWAGEYASAVRKGRRAFSGYVSGSVLVIAQPGSSARVFSASKGTGLAERFFYLSEPTPLGTRQHHGEFVARHELEPFGKACRSCVQDYSTRRFDALEDAQDPDRLHQLSFTAEGYQLMLETRRRIEPTLGRLANDGELVQVGWLGKIETHTMKVAAVLHVVECLANGCKPPAQIPLKTVQTALEFVEVLGGHLAGLLHDSGETGEAAEVDAVMELLGRRGYKTRALAQALRKRHPFRGMGTEAYQRARSRIDAMITEGRLVVGVNGTLEPC